MSKVRFVCAATLLAVCSQVHAYTLFVSAYSQPYRIQKWDLATKTYVNSFATGGSLNDTKDMAIGPDGSLYVANRGNANVLRYNATTGEYLGVFASTPPGESSFSPQAMEFGSDGNLYVSSYADGRVLRYNGSTGAFMNTVVGSVRTPAGLEFGPDGTLYVSSYTDNAVYKFDPDTGASLGTFAAISMPEDIQFGSDGNLYVASLGRTGMYTPPGRGIYRFSPTGTNLGRFVDHNYAYGLQFAPDGDLYVSSYNASIVYKYDGATGAYKDVVRTADNIWAAGGYILITPEPASLVLLAVGGGLLLRRRGRAA